MTTHWGQEQPYLQAPEHQHRTRAIPFCLQPQMTSLGLDLWLLGTLCVYREMSYSFFLIIHMTSDDLGAHCLMKTYCPGFSVQYRPSLIVWL